MNQSVRVAAPVRIPTPTLRIFVISLKRREDRRQHMRGLLDRLGLTAEFIDAVDGRALTPDQQASYHRSKALSVYGAEMNAAELGCHLSHLAVYRRIVEEKIDVALVLEDDIECDADLPQLLHNLVQDARSEWLVLRLQSTKTAIIDSLGKSARGDAVSRHRGRAVGRLRTGVLGGCGYLIKREGAKRMLAYSARPFMPIDQTMDRYWENGIIPYVLRPFPVRQCDAIASEIGERKVKARLGLRLTAVRRARRAFDGLNKRRFQFTRMGGWRELPLVAASAAFLARLQAEPDNAAALQARV